MELVVPVRQNVFIELNGARMADAQSVKCTCIKERRAIRAFGEAEPVAWLERPPAYKLEFSLLRLHGGNAAALHDLRNFRLTTVQNGIRVTYSGCEWQQLTEQAEPGDAALVERAVVSAEKREEGLV